MKRPSAPWDCLSPASCGPHCCFQRGRRERCFRWPRASGLLRHRDCTPAPPFRFRGSRTMRVFVRLIALPGNAFAEIEKTMTDERPEASRAWSLRSAKALPLPRAKGTAAGRAPASQRGPDPQMAADRPDLVTSLRWCRSKCRTRRRRAIRPQRSAPRWPAWPSRPVVPTDEQLALVPFKARRTGRLAAGARGAGRRRAVDRRSQGHH